MNTFRRFTPGRKTGYPLHRRLVSGQKGQSELLRKILLPPGVDPTTIQPVVSRYTEYVIPAYIPMFIWCVFYLTAPNLFLLTLLYLCKLPNFFINPPPPKKNHGMSENAFSMAPFTFCILKCSFLK